MAANKKTGAISNVYTAILALVTGTVLATAVFVAMKCMTDYDTIFKIVEVAR